MRCAELAPGGVGQLAAVCPLIRKSNKAMRHNLKMQRGQRGHLLQCVVCACVLSVACCVQVRVVLCA